MIGDITEESSRRRGITFVVVCFVAAAVPNRFGENTTLTEAAISKLTN